MVLLLLICYLPRKESVILLIRCSKNKEHAIGSPQFILSRSMNAIEISVDEFYDLGMICKRAVGSHCRKIMHADEPVHKVPKKPWQQSYRTAPVL